MPMMSWPCRGARPLTYLQGPQPPGKATLGEAGLSLDDLDLVETHDCFTIAEMLEYEAMGLAECGQGHRVIREGITERGGRLPVNLSGGLKGTRPPVGGNRCVNACHGCDAAHR